MLYFRDNIYSYHEINHDIATSTSKVLISFSSMYIAYMYIYQFAKFTKFSPAKLSSFKIKVVAIYMYVATDNFTHNTKAPVVTSSTTRSNVILTCHMLARLSNTWYLELNTDHIITC